MDFIIVTGMSGAGKSVAVDKLEDIGYFCVDNVPPQMINKFVKLHGNSQGYTENMAIVVDTRSREPISEFIKEIELLRESNYSFKILFIDASTEVIFNRFKEKRRKHPMINEDNNSDLRKAIEDERETLEDIKQQADFIIDTTHIKTGQLKNQISELFLQDSGTGMIMQIMSFGFKYGAPMDADIVFDVRCLPNPFYIPELKYKTGLTAEVSDYVMSFPESQSLLEKLIELFDLTYPLYVQEGKNRLVIAIGCTGGMHRSITFAERIAKHFKEKGVKVSINHRDKDKNPKVINDK